MITQAPRGTKDIYGDDIQAYTNLSNIIRNVCKNFGVSEIKTPIFEHTELFLRGVGDTTDIVQKEMYTFNDKSNRSITLKPEGTAGVARAFIEHKMFANVSPVKLFYIEPSFRYERPEAGRLRQFHQFGAELFGSSSAYADSEIISLAYTIFNELELRDTQLQINSLGGSVCRQKYNDTLKHFISTNLDMLCPTCVERYEKNPLRVLDCKLPKCQSVVNNAPSVIDCLDTECLSHFELLMELLVRMGISFTVNPRIVRGLDYYTRTVFEFISNDIGSQGTICGGGRYDNLIEQCGGPATGAVGFAVGIERLLLTLKNQNKQLHTDWHKDIYVGSIGEKGKKFAGSLVYDLRNRGIAAEGDVVVRSVKAQLKYADKIGARFSIIIGDNEIESNTAFVKDMSSSEQKQISLSNLDGLLQLIAVE